MQHLEGSDTPVLYMGRTVLKGQRHRSLFIKPYVKTAIVFALQLQIYLIIFYFAMLSVRQISYTCLDSAMVIGKNSLF